MIYVACTDSHKLVVTCSHQLYPPGTSSDAEVGMEHQWLVTVNGGNFLWITDNWQEMVNDDIMMINNV